jgi:S1-C subfamily serine protease
VIPISVRQWDETEVIDKVQSSYADFIWGMPPQTYPIYPSLGVSSRLDDESGHRTVIHVEEDSVGARAGFELGDVFLEFDGHPIDDQSELRRLMAEKRWGDRATFKIERNGETTILDVEFRRTLPEIE